MLLALRTVKSCLYATFAEALRAAVLVQLYTPLHDSVKVRKGLRNFKESGKVNLLNFTFRAVKCKYTQTLLLDGCQLLFEEYLQGTKYLVLF